MDRGVHTWAWSGVCGAEGRVGAIVFVLWKGSGGKYRSARSLGSVFSRRRASHTGLVELSFMT